MKLKTMQLPLVLLITTLVLGACATAKAPLPDTEPSDAMANAEAAPQAVMIPMIQKENSYIGTDILESYKVFHYDGDRLETVEQFNSFDEPVEFTVYEYEGVGEPVRKLVYESGEKLRSMRRFSYTTVAGEPELAREEVYTRNEELQTVLEYLYEGGELTRWSVKDGSESLMAYTEYRYESGLNTRIDTYSADGTLRDYFVLKYTGGRLTEQQKFDQDGTPAGKVEYLYSGDLRTGEKRYRANGSLERSIAYEYDREGSIVRETYRRADETVEQVISRDYAYREEQR